MQNENDTPVVPSEPTSDAGQRGPWTVLGVEGVNWVRVNGSPWARPPVEIANGDAVTVCMDQRPPNPVAPYGPVDDVTAPGSTGADKPVPPTDQIETEAIDKLYLELSQFSKATTPREMALNKKLDDEVKRFKGFFRQLQDLALRYADPEHRTELTIAIAEVLLNESTAEPVEEWRAWSVWSLCGRVDAWGLWRDGAYTGFHYSYNAHCDEPFQAGENSDPRMRVFGSRSAAKAHVRKLADSTDGE